MKFILPLLFVLVSCASDSKYPFEIIESKTSTYQDVLTRTDIMTTVYPGIDRLAFEYLKNGRINRDIKYSCFEKRDSVNYINISKENVPLFRPYVITSKKKITYKLKDGFRNSIYAKLYVEESSGEIEVETKICFRGFTDKEGEEQVMVVSEFYTEAKSEKSPRRGFHDRR
jgi:hypothetical protein